MKITPRNNFLKLIDKRTGWVGENCWAPAGRRYIKRLEHRHNRRALNNQLKKEME